MINLLIKQKTTFALILSSIILISCGGGGGGGSGSADTSLPLPTISFSTSIDSTDINTEVTLTWSSTNSSSCSASGDWSGSKAVSGSELVKIKKKGDNSYSLSCTGDGGSLSRSLAITGVLNFTVTAPTSLSDYEPFNISLSGYELDEGQVAEIIVNQSSGKDILFPNTEDVVFSARAPATYNSETIVLDVTLKLSDSIEEKKEVTMDVSFNNVALKFDDFLEFNPAADIAASLENDNYFIWDIIPFAEQNQVRFLEVPYIVIRLPIYAIQPLKKDQFLDLFLQI